MHALRVLLVAALLVPLAAPSTAAQGAVTPTLTVAVTDPGEDLVTTRPSSLEVRVRFAYGPGGWSNEPVAVTLEVLEKPEWVTDAKIAMPVIQFETPPERAPTGGAVEAMTTVELTLEPLAPARERAEIVLGATSAPRGSFASASARSPPVGLQAAFLDFIEVSAPAEVRLRGGIPTTVPFTVTNNGNGETDVNLRIRTKPESSIVEPIPATITLARGATAEVPVVVRVPWTSSESGFLELEATSVRAADRAEPVVGAAEVRGVSAVGAAPPLWVVALVAAVGIGLGRRR